MALRADQAVDVLGAEIAAFGADEDGIDGFGVALGEFQLRFGGQILVFGDADDQRVAARHSYRRRGRGVVLLVFEIAALLLILLGLRQRAGRKSKETSDAPDVVHTPPVLIKERGRNHHALFANTVVLNEEQFARRCFDYAVHVLGKLAGAALRPRMCRRSRRGL